MTPAAPTAIKPANQKLRIAVLRLFALAVLPLILFTRSHWPEDTRVFEFMENIGIFLVIGAVLGRFWSILYIGAMKNRTVMEEGPYSICRHPLYFFSTMGVLGLGLMLGSFILAATLSIATFLILSATAAREEAFLRHEFGPTYERYAARVPRIWPKPSLFHAEPTVTSSVRALRVNFADALVFLAFIPLAEVAEAVKSEGLLPTIPLW